MCDEVNVFNPDVLFVGMTAPKQEKWVHLYKNELNANTICSIGAVFDFYAGNIERAPKLMINLGLEWLHRSFKSSRLLRRNFISNPKFIIHNLKVKILKKNQMRIVIITQDEPFYLAKNLSYLIKILPEHSEIVGCVVADVSPFGKKESFLKKAKKTFDVFGLFFFSYYSFKYLVSKFNSKTNVFKLLNLNDIPIITLEYPINNINSVNKIKLFKPDLLVSILGNQIFKEPILN